MTTCHRQAQPAARAHRTLRGSCHDSHVAAVSTAAGGAAGWANVIDAGDPHASVGPDGSKATAASTGSDAVGEPADSSDTPEAARSTDSGDTVGLAEDLGYAICRASNYPKEPGLMDPTWVRLAFAGMVSLLLAVGPALPGWVRLAFVTILMLAAAQSRSAFVRVRRNLGGTVVMTISGLSTVASVYLLDDMGVVGLVTAFSVLLAFADQMLCRDGRHNLVEDPSSTVAGCLVAIFSSAWCALEPGLADLVIAMPTCLVLFVGAVLTVFSVCARMLEILIVTTSALFAEAIDYVLASAGFFGLSHISAATALQGAAACVAVGLVAGVLMASGNRVLWIHHWVLGGRVTMAPVLIPILSVGVPVHTITRPLSGFIAG